MPLFSWNHIFCTSSPKWLKPNAGERERIPSINEGHSLDHMCNLSSAVAGSPSRNFVDLSSQEGGSRGSVLV